MEVVKLLRSKNRCLERFLDASEAFLEKAGSGDFSSLEAMENLRDSALKAMDLYDRKVATVISLLPSEQKTEQLSEELERIIARKYELLRKISQVDEKIILYLEQEKSRISKELISSHKANAAVKKFKSTWVTESGEELDKKL